MFASDRDLLVIEPGVLRDAAWAGQRVLDTTGSVSGTALTIASGSLIDAGIDAGSVILIDSLPVEVVTRDSATACTVSLLRGDTASPALGPGTASGRPVRAYTFAPQLAMVHRQVLAMIGIDPDAQGGLDASAVTNPGALVRLEALGALHLLYASAAAPGRGGEAMSARAEAYRDRFARERERVVALIDTDGDGIAEAARRPSVFAMTRG